MGNLKLTENEEKLIEKYQIESNQEIAMYFFNKMANDLINIVYSKINLKFTSIPFEKEDLLSIAWKTIKEAMKEYKKSSYSFRSIIINKMYFKTIREIRKYLKNSELIMNIASSWDTYTQTHTIYQTTKNAIILPKAILKCQIDDVIEFIVKCSKKWEKQEIKQLIYLKSLGFSEREIALKFKKSRKYVNNMMQNIIKLSKIYLKEQNN